MGLLQGFHWILEYQKVIYEESLATKVHKELGHWLVTLDLVIQVLQWKETIYWGQVEHIQGKTGLPGQ